MYFIWDISCFRQETNLLPVNLSWLEAEVWPTVTISMDLTLNDLLPKNPGTHKKIR